MKRLFWIITIWFSAMTWSTADERADPRSIDLKMEMPGGLGPVQMSEQPTVFVVQLPIGGGSSLEKRPPPDLDNLNLQVWLLTADGASIPQHDKPARIGIGNAGFDTDYLVFTFDRVPSSAPAGIVLRVKGKLYCQAITSEGK